MQLCVLSLQVENARGYSRAELMWNQPLWMALGTPLPTGHLWHLWGLLCLDFREKKKPRGSHFSSIFTISAKSQRAEVGRSLEIT